MCVDAYNSLFLSLLETPIRLSMNDKLPLELWKKIYDYVNEEEFHDLNNQYSNLSSTEVESIWKNYIKKHYFLTFYDHTTMQFNCQKDYKLYGSSYYQLLLKLQKDDSFVKDLIDFYCILINNDNNAMSSGSLIESMNNQLYNSFNYYLPQLMREQRHVRYSDHKEIKGERYITSKTFYNILDDRKSNLKRIYIATKLIESYNIYRLYKEFENFHWGSLNVNNRGDDNETFYLKFSMIDPMFYDSLITRHNVIAKTLKNFKPVEDSNYTPPASIQVSNLTKVLLKELKKQRSFHRNDDDDTKSELNFPSPIFLSRTYMGEFDLPFRLIPLIVRKLCKNLGYYNRTRLEEGFLRILNEDNNSTYILTVIGEEFRSFGHHALNLKSYVEYGSDESTNAINEQGLDYENYFNNENIIAKQGDLPNLIKIEKIEVNNEEFVIAKSKYGLQSELTMIGKKIPWKLFNQWKKMTIYRVFQPRLINLFNKCLYKDSEFNDDLKDDWFSYKNLISRERICEFNNSTVHEYALKAEYERYGKYEIGEIVKLNTGKFGVITNIIAINGTQTSECIVQYLIQIDADTEYSVRGDCFSRNDIKGAIDNLLSFDIWGKWFTGFDGEKFYK